jgi:hypothetical protein
MSDTAELAVFLRAVVQEIDALKPVKGVKTGTHLYNVKMVLLNLDIPVMKQPEFIMDGVSDMVGRNSGLSSLIANDVKNIIAI